MSPSVFQLDFYIYIIFCKPAMFLLTNVLRLCCSSKMLHHVKLFGYRQFARLDLDAQIAVCVYISSLVVAH